MNQKELSRARKQFRDGSPEHRERTGAAFLEKAAANVIGLEDKLRAVGKLFRRQESCWTGKESPTDENPHTDPDAHSRARLCRTGALAAWILETGLAAFVCSRALNFATWVAALIGAGVAAILTLIVKGALVRIYHPEFPLRSYEIVRRWVIVTFAVSIAAVFPLLAARTLGWAAILATISLTTLGVSLPLLSGSLLVMAFTIDWAQRLMKAHDALTEEILETRRFLAEHGPEFPPKPPRPSAMGHDGNQGPGDKTKSGRSDFPVRVR